VNGVGIIGAGGWGTAIAVMLGKRGVPVTLWARRPEVAAALSSERENAVYLPGIRLPDAVSVTGDLAAAAAHRFLVLAVPSQAVGRVWAEVVRHITPAHTVLNVAKGLDEATGRRLSEVIAAQPSPVPVERLAVLSGPNHAEEVGRGVPTASVVASASRSTAELWQELLMGPEFRVYTNDDVAGVELGGALKNVIALAAGMSDGLGFGDNTKAAIITRGLSEMARLGAAMGARVLTFSGLSGMGDLVATCTSGHSRNMRAGRRIGRGEPPDAVAASTPMVIEGVPTCRAALILAKRYGVDMPITEAVGAVLFDGKAPSEAVAELMGRGPKDELQALLS